VYPVAEESIQLGNIASEESYPSDQTRIDIRNASFAWTVGGPPVINNISLSILRKRFVFIIGPVGCGKSTLLKGLMSETPFSQGFVYSSLLESSFVDQTPWIQNTTIQQIVLGSSLLDLGWYEEVVRACALDHDVAALPDSHRVLIQASTHVSEPQVY
jgi:ABC-type bacteriocin/lantibiotic exporter with double-glycine peptidase domain